MHMVSQIESMLSTLAQFSRTEATPQDSYEISAWITHYGSRFSQRSLGCYGYGPYSSDDPSIIAVNPTLYKDLPCGSVLELCGAGGCLTAARKDSCPGCRPDGLDLSEAGFKQVCGDADGVCTASVKVVKVCEARHFSAQKPDEPPAPGPESRFPLPVPCQHPNIQ